MADQEQMTSTIWAVVAVIGFFVAAAISIAVFAESDSVVPILTALFGGLATIGGLFVLMLRTLREIRSGVKEANHALNGELHARLLAAAIEANRPLEASVRTINQRLAEGDRAFAEVREGLAAVQGRLDELTSCEVEPQ